MGFTEPASFLTRFIPALYIQWYVRILNRQFSAVLYTMFTFISSIAFLFAWLIFIIIAGSANDELPLFSVYFMIGLPLAQAVTFTVYRTNRQKQMIGGAILAVMAVSLAANLRVLGISCCLTRIAQTPITTIAKPNGTIKSCMN
jgi:hypothetical protein